MAERQRLYAADDDDLAVISALMQDAVVAARDIAYDARARRLVMVVSRYRWEGKSTSRVRTALRVEGLCGLRRRGWPELPGAVLELLALRANGDVLEIDFAGGCELRAEIECIDVELHDLSAAWRAGAVPRHEP